MTRPLLTSLLVLSAALAGCSGGSDDEATPPNPTAPPADGLGGGDNTTAPVPPVTPGGGDDGDGNGTTPGGGTPTGSNHAPVALLTPSVTTGVAPLLVNFTVNGTDEDGDELSWILDFGDGSSSASGDVFPFSLEHSFGVGTYDVMLVVRDEELQGNQTVNVTVTGLVPGSGASVDDPDSDSSGEFSEILDFTATFDGAMLTATIHFAEIWPSTDVVSGAQYALFVNGNKFNSFVRYAIDNNPLTWDATAGAYTPDGFSTWDTGSGTVTFEITAEYLGSVGYDAPYSVHVESTNGALNNNVASDRAPDSGEVPV